MKDNLFWLKPIRVTLGLISVISDSSLPAESLAFDKA